MAENRQKGFAAGFTAYLIWGFLPVYWKLLGVVPSLELLAWRVAGCSVFAWIVVLTRGRRSSRSLFTRRTIRLLITAALLIAANWGLYIWAVNSERILEASLGYYINPLVNVVLGVLFFSEPLGPRRKIAIILALVGVVLMTLYAGVFPWVSLVLALTFGFYALTVKKLPQELDSIEVLAWVTGILGPFAAGYIVFAALSGTGGGWHLVGYGPTVTVLLLVAGLVTLLPLWLFGVGAKRLPLGVLGFLQYVAPTLMLLLGVLVYGEPFGGFRIAAFALVLAALAVYSSTFRDS